MTGSAAFQTLTDEEITHAAQSTPSDEWVPIIPVPDGVRREIPRHSLGKPVKVWPYLNARGQICGAIARFETPDGKEERPLTYCEKNGVRKWWWKAMPAPRTLYRTDVLAENPTSVVLVVEGEKAADAAQLLFPDLVTTTSAMGANSSHQSDWDALQGRVVVIWPDHDEPGAEYASSVSGLALKAGAASVSVVDVPSDFQEKWDLAEPVPDGWTGEQLRELVEAARPLETETKANPYFDVRVNGVYKLVEKENKSTGETEREWTWFCSPLDVAAETRDNDGENWGRLLVVKDRDGAEHEWALPMELLAGSGEEYRRHLLSAGLIMSPGRFARDALHEYLSTARPADRARCVTRTGWQESNFILPDETFGNTRGERVLLQTLRPLDHAFRVAGTLENWQQHIAQYAAGNSRLAFSLSAAFAAPLLGPCDAEGGGFHFRGSSSIGKSTAMVVAGSVWGGGTVKGYIRQWRATDNGLEAVAQTHCDALLCLDELSQVDPKAAGQSAYMLANGAGKSRAGRGGEGRRPAEWRILFLSNGEIGLADKLAEDGRGRKAAAGQQVRIVDMPADAGAGLGIFENIHGFDTPDAFARHLKQAASEHYGAPIRAFLSELVTDLEAVRQSVAGFKNDFVAQQCPAEADGQVRRVADRFGLVAAGGELATVMGILPWDRGEATSAAASCFQAWLDGRGGIEPAEITAGVAQVRRFIGQHGESRFSPWVADGGHSTVNRAGFRRMNGDGDIEYYVLPQAWKTEVCAGFDAGQIARVLMERYLLIPDSDGKPQSRHRLPGSSGPVRCYRLASRILGGGDV